MSKMPAFKAVENQRGEHVGPGESRLLLILCAASFLIWLFHDDAVKDYFVTLQRLAGKFL
jgi:hypothetical protein